MGCSHNSCVAKEKHDNSSKYKPQNIHAKQKDIIIAVEDPRSQEIIKEFYFQIGLEETGKPQLHGKEQQNNMIGSSGSNSQQHHNRSDSPNSSNNQSSSESLMQIMNSVFFSKEGHQKIDVCFHSLFDKSANKFRYYLYRLFNIEMENVRCPYSGKMWVLYIDNLAHDWDAIVDGNAKLDLTKSLGKSQTKTGSEQRCMKLIWKYEYYPNASAEMIAIRHELTQSDNLNYLEERMKRLEKEEKEEEQEQEKNQGIIISRDEISQGQNGQEIISSDNKLDEGEDQQGRNIGSEKQQQQQQQQQLKNKKKVSRGDIENAQISPQVMETLNSQMIQESNTMLSPIAYSNNNNNSAYRQGEESKIHNNTEVTMTAQNKSKLNSKLGFGDSRLVFGDSSDINAMKNNQSNNNNKVESHYRRVSGDIFSAMQATSQQQQQQPQSTLQQQQDQSQLLLLGAGSSNTTNIPSCSGLKIVYHHSQLEVPPTLKDMQKNQNSNSTSSGQLGKQKRLSGQTDSVFLVTEEESKHIRPPMHTEAGTDVLDDDAENAANKFSGLDSYRANQPQQQQHFLETSKDHHDILNLNSNNNNNGSSEILNDRNQCGSSSCKVSAGALAPTPSKFVDLILSCSDGNNTPGLDENQLDSMNKNDINTNEGSENIQSDRNSLKKMQSHLPKIHQEFHGSDGVSFADTTPKNNLKQFRSSSKRAS